MLEATAESGTFNHSLLDKSLNDTLVPNPPPASSPSWPTQYRIVQLYNNVETLKLDTEHLYCLQRRTNPLFDSFCLETSPNEVILWVFQMMISKEHGAVVSGFTILSTIVQMIKESFKVEVKFVLVAPYKFSQVVKWNFPKELEDYSLDKVYVQYLDVSLDNYDVLLNPPSPLARV